MIWMRPSRPFLGDAVVLARIIEAGRGIFGGFVDGRPSDFCCSLWNLFCHEQHEFLTGLIAMKISAIAISLILRHIQNDGVLEICL